MAGSFRRVMTVFDDFFQNPGDLCQGAHGRCQHGGRGGGEARRSSGQEDLVPGGQGHQALRLVQEVPAQFDEEAADRRGDAGRAQEYRGAAVESVSALFYYAVNISCI